MAATAVTAHAGEWVVSYQYGDSKSSGSMSSVDWPNVTTDFVYPVISLGEATYDWEGQTRSGPTVSQFKTVSQNLVELQPDKGAAEAKIDATIQMKLRWQTDSNEPVPAAVRVTVNASASAKACANINNPLPSVREGKGEQAVASVSVGDYSSSGEEIFDLTYTHKSASIPANKRTFLLKTNGNASLDGPKIVLKAQANLGGGRETIRHLGPPFLHQGPAGTHPPSLDQPFSDPGSLSASANFSANAETDARSVTLSRGGRYEHSELEDGKWNTYGDSIYSAHSASGFSNHDFKSQVNLGVSYGGSSAWGIRSDGTAPYITPSWSASGFSSTFEQSPQAYKGYAQYGSPLFDSGEYSGSATGAASFVTSYTATDTRDGATAEASYHLKLHDPVEEVATTSSGYSLFAPVSDSTGVIAFSGGSTGRPTGQKLPTSEVRIGTSTETGYSLTATTEVSAFSKLLGFSAAWTATSTNSVNVDTTLEVPAIAKDRFVYVIAQHDFQRVHKRFFLYDQSGEVRRMMTHDNNGVPYATPFQVYHEAFRDRAFEMRFNWSTPKDTATVTVDDIADQPKPQKPALEYDYPSGGSA